MKDIAIVTLFHKSYNYGAVLQAYALQIWLKQNGLESDVLRIDCDASASQKKRMAPPARKMKRTCWQKIKKLLTKAVLFSRRRKFDAFSRSHMNISDRIYSDADIGETNQKYEAFIAGSDMIWYFNFSYDSCFLNFVSDRHLKIAYAACIGTEKIDEAYMRYMIPLLERFDFISVRERASVQLLSGRVHQKVHCVLDPVFLLPLEHWVNMCKKSHKKKDYILVYLLGYSKEMHRLVQSLSEKLHLKPVVIPFGTMKLSRVVMQIKGKKIVAASPIEFLTLMKNAKYVITDSFHGTVFSIIFHKCFCAVPRKDRNEQPRMGLRIYDILERFGLEDRIQQSLDDVLRVLYTEVDYEAVEKRLEKERTHSINYLKEALKGKAAKNDEEYSDESDRTVNGSSDT